MEQPAVYADKLAMKSALVSYNDQKDREDDRKANNIAKKEAQTVLLKILKFLWSHCDITLQNKILAEIDFQVMKDSNGGEMY